MIYACLIGQWLYLIQYLEDGGLELSNNPFPSCVHIIEYSKMLKYLKQLQYSHNQANAKKVNI